jgi:predicted MFS family arabinose efflux permease
MAGGAAALSVAWALVAWRLDAAGVLLGACLAAAGAAFLHTSFQLWATMAAPAARGAAVALFAGSLFVGGAVGAQAGGAVVERLGAAALFGGFAALALVHGAAVSVMRARRPGG